MKCKCSYEIPEIVRQWDLEGQMMGIKFMPFLILAGSIWLW